MSVKLTQSYVESFKPDGKPHWIRDARVSKLLLFIGKKGKKTWYVDYTRSDGKRDHYKIGEADIIALSAAQEKAKEILARLRLDGDFSLKPQPQQSQIQPSPPPTPSIKLRDFIDEHYAQWVTDSRRAGTATLAMLRKAFADFMDQPIAAITPLQIEQWRVKYRQEQNLKAASLNRYITTLKAALNWGVKHNIIDVNPAAKLENLREEDSVHKTRYLTGEERKRLYEALDARDTRLREERVSYNKWLAERKKPLFPDLNQVPFADHLKPIVLLSLNTGVRRRALLSLIWGDVDFTHKILILRQSIQKTSRDGFVNLNNTAIDTLKKWHSQSADTSDRALIFPSPQTGKIMDNCGSSWDALLKAADIKDFRWHDMRHDFASQLVMNGVDLNTVRSLMGHSDLKMTLRYAHLAPEITQNAVNSLDVWHDIHRDSEQKGD